MEHYRPKKAVHTLLRRGTELSDLNNVRGRSKVRSASFDQGYWWLAWSWHNYLLACDVCNRAWKRSFFHIEGGHTQPPSPASADSEVPLLLHPWEGPDPVDQLTYDELGEIEPAHNSAAGRTTISICGLDRERLRDAREEKARQTFRACRVLINALQADGAGVEQASADLASLGRIDRESAGMVRSIALHHFGLPWAHVEALASMRPKSGTPAGPLPPG